MDGKADLILGFAHDLDGEDRGCRRSIARKARIGECLGDEGERATRQAQHRPSPIAIWNVGGLWTKDEGASVYINQNLTLAASHLFASIVAA